MKAIFPFEFVAPANLIYPVLEHLKQEGFFECELPVENKGFYKIKLPGQGIGITIGYNSPLGVLKLGMFLGRSFPDLDL